MAVAGVNRLDRIEAMTGYYNNGVLIYPMGRDDLRLLIDAAREAAENAESSHGSYCPQQTGPYPCPYCSERYPKLNALLAEEPS